MTLLDKISCTVFIVCVVAYIGLKCATDIGTPKAKEAMEIIFGLSSIVFGTLFFLFVLSMIWGWGL